MGGESGGRSRAAVENSSLTDMAYLDLAIHYRKPANSLACKPRPSICVLVHTSAGKGGLRDH